MGSETVRTEADADEVRFSRSYNRRDTLLSFVLSVSTFFPSLCLPLTRCIEWQWIAHCLLCQHWMSAWLSAWHLGCVPVSLSIYLPVCLSHQPLSLSVIQYSCLFTRLFRSFSLSSSQKRKYRPGGCRQAITLVWFSGPPIGAKPEPSPAHPPN